MDGMSLFHPVIPQKPIIIMKTTPLLSLGFTAVVLAFVLTALCLRDPMVHKCRTVGWQLSRIKKNVWNEMYLEECRHMLREAESLMHKAQLCKAQIRATRQHYAPSHEHSRALSRLEAQQVALRAEADSLLEEIRFVMDVRRQDP